MYRFTVVLNKQNAEEGKFYSDDYNKVQIEGDAYYEEDGLLAIKKAGNVIALFAVGSWRYVRVG